MNPLTFLLLFILSTLASFADEVAPTNGPFLGGFSDTQIEDMIKNNPLRNMKPEQVRELIRQNYQGTMVGSFLEEYPRFETFIVHIFQDEHALAGLWAITKQKRKLRNLSLFSLLIIIVGFYYSAVLTRDERSIIKRWGKKFMLRLCVFGFTAMISSFVN